MASKFELKLKLSEDAVQDEKINIDNIKKIAFDGIPDKPGLRSTYWKLMLDYLPLERTEWLRTLREKRKIYGAFVDDLVVDPKQLRKNTNNNNSSHSGNSSSNSNNNDGANTSSSTNGGNNGMSAEPMTDDPLSQDKDSKWKTWFEDRHLLSEIDKDVRRTLTHIHFFSQANTSHDLHSRVLKTGSATGDKSIESITIDASSMDEEYETVVGIKRILFLYAKLNPGIMYVQGMNEILAPLLYVCSSDPFALDSKDAEADAFFCFTALMSEIRDNFMKTMDGTDIGINGRILEMNRTLKRVRPDLWQILEEVSLHPQFYSLRWLTLLFSQEFQLPDVLRLWDSLLSDPNRFEFLLYFGCAMVSLQADVIRTKDFSEILKTFQDTSSTKDMDTVLKEALRLRDLDPKKKRFWMPFSPT